MSDYRNPEFELLVCIAKGGDQAVKQGRIIDLIEQGLDWKYFHQLAEYHGMLPNVYLALKSLETGLVPEESISSLENYFFLNTQRNISLLNELLKLVELIEENGISVIPLKGPILSKILFDNYSTRQSGDLDLLVKTQDVVKVVSILEELDFHHSTPMTQNQQIAIVNISLEHHHLLTRDRDKLDIEVQWGLVYTDMMENEDTGFLWDCVKSESIQSSIINIFTQEALVLVLSLHGYKHAWCRLFWLWEFAQLLEKHRDLDWDWILDHSEKFGSQRVLLIACLVANTIIGTEIPLVLKQKINIDQQVIEIANSINITPAPGKLEAFNNLDPIHFSSRFDLKDTFEKRLKHFFKYLFTPDYFDISLLNLKPSQHFLYYFIRPIGFGIKIFTGRY